MKPNDVTTTTEPTSAQGGINIPETLTPTEVAFALGVNPQSIRNQIHVDMKEHTNEQNFNAFKVGAKLMIPARWFWDKMTGNGVGKEFEVNARFAGWMIRHGFAKEVQSNDHNVQA